MNSHTTYLIYGPTASLIRMAEKLFTDHPPKFLHSRSFNAIQTKLDVAVYEEYDKQINSSITLTCIFETTPQHNKILLKKLAEEWDLGEAQSVSSKVLKRL